jgi:hypothetical protein
MKYVQLTAALGCVPYLTSHAVVAELLTVDRYCIVIDKQAQASSARQRLASGGSGIETRHLPGFDEVGVLDQDDMPPLIGPTSGLPEPIELGPVRLAGWRRDATGRPRPLLHAKMLVLGIARFTETDMGEAWGFDAKRTWMGSANWTEAAVSHLEFGVWSDDPRLVAANFRFLLDVLRFSERSDSATAGPEPDLVDAVWAPDEDFIEYLREYGPSDEPDSDE